jgi:hypothetical protein
MVAKIARSLFAERQKQFPTNNGPDSNSRALGQFVLSIFVDFWVHAAEEGLGRSMDWMIHKRSIT